MHPYVTTVKQDTSYHLRMAMETFVNSPRKVSIALAVLGTASLLVQPVALPLLAAGATLAIAHAVKSNDRRLRRRLNPDDLMDFMGKRRPPDPNETTVGMDEDERPLVFDSDQMRQHFLVLGPHGTARTDFLACLVEQVVSRNSGAVVCISRDDERFVNRFLAAARQMNREDDVLILDTAYKSTGEIRSSNTFNPFATAPSEVMVQVLNALAQAGGESTRNNEVATVLAKAVMVFLAWKRDTMGSLPIHVGTIGYHLDLDVILGMADPSEYPDMPPDVRLSIRKYLTFLPGYNAERGRRQPQVTLDAHADTVRTYKGILERLDQAYGEILNVADPDIDMFDVARNRRILVVVLDTAPDNRENALALARLTSASLRMLLGSMLENRLEGTWGEVVSARCMNSPSPFICAMDDIESYATPGMALMAAQARALGFSMLYGTKDIPEMKRDNEKEAASIIANTNTKIIFPKAEERNGIPIKEGDDRYFEVINGDRVYILRPPDTPSQPLPARIPNGFVALNGRKTAP